MVAAPTFMNLQSLKSAMHVLRATALVTGLSLMLASAGQAIVIDFDQFNDSPISEIDVDLDGHAAKIKTELREVDFQITANGPIRKLKYIAQTIEFVNGPMEVTGVRLERLAKKGFLMGDDAWMKIDGDDLTGTRRVQKITRFQMGEFLGLKPADTQPPIANPVPEPGAALLFAAGLTAIGATRRTNR